MLYDAFPFFNELELLELRLHELAPIVDRFVLVEAPRTHSNLPKPLYFNENRAAFRPFLDKITHIIVEDMPDAPNPWVRESFQRDCISRGLHGCQPQDIVMVSDVDEIPRAAVLREVVRTHPFRSGAVGNAWRRLWKRRLVVRLFGKLFKKWHPFVTVFEHQQHLYFLNCVRVGKPWLGTRLVRYRDLGSPNDLRCWGGARIANAGWHFSFMGGVERIQSKLSAWAHQEYNLPQYTNTPWLSEALDRGKHLFHRPVVELQLQQIDDSYPAYLRENPSRFKHWIRLPARG